MAIISRGFAGRRSAAEAKLPPGQSRDSLSAKVVAEAFPNTRDTTTVLGKEECR